MKIDGVDPSVAGRRPAAAGERTRMKTNQPGDSERLREEQATQPEWDVLHCLEQCVILLDSMLARWRQADGGLPADEWRAIAKNLSVVSNVLRFLGENAIPSLLANRHGAGPLPQHAASEMLNRLCRQTAELELCFKAAQATLN